MIGVVVLVVLLMTLVRVVVSRRGRRAAALSAELSQTQPLTEWSARFPADRDRVARRGRSGGF